jgi:phosphohistidine phosphatase
MPTKSRASPTTTVLCVIRHGDAGDALADSERDKLRPLSGRGRKEAKKAGHALARLGLLPRDVWTSHLVRAVETAEKAVSAAGADVPLRSVASLSPEANPERVLQALAENPPPPDASAAGGDVVVRWVVGHEPHLSRLVGLLVAAQPMGLALSKGSVSIVETVGSPPSAGAGRLLALLSASALKALE